MDKKWQQFKNCFFECNWKKKKFKRERFLQNPLVKDTFMRETGKFCLFLKERSRRSTYLSSIWISIDGSDFFFIRDFIGSCLIQRQIERKRERVMLAFRLRRKDNRLVNTSRIIVHKSSSVKRASMREIRLLGSKDVSTRRTSIEPPSFFTNNSLYHRYEFHRIYKI